jgi:hypothetical protein
MAVGGLAGRAFGPDNQLGPRVLSATPELPAGQIEAARYIASHRQAGDLCQDGEGDPSFRWASFSHCPPWWIDFNAHPRSNATVLARAAEWQSLNGLAPAERLAALRLRGVRWYSAAPGFAFPSELSAGDPRSPLAPVFATADGYVVYQIPR